MKRMPPPPLEHPSDVLVGPVRPLRSMANEIGLAVCAVIFLGAYTYEVVADPAGIRLHEVEILLWATWALFAVDWLVALVRDNARGSHLLEHLLGFLVVALPVCAPLRVLRLLSLIVLLQRLVLRGSFRMTVVWYAVASSLLAVYIAALGVLELEKNAPGSSITSFGQSLWWACATVATVGYGDAVPVTLGGRIIALVLMIGGIALLGIVTATLASWLAEQVVKELAEDVERAESEEEASLAVLQAEVRALRDEIAQLREVLDPHIDR